MPSFPVHHQLLEFAQIHVHQVGDAIQPSHPLSSLPLLPSILSSNRVFSSESVLPIRWPKYWSFSFSISPFNEYSGLISFRIDLFDLLAVQGALRVFYNTTVEKNQNRTENLLLKDGYKSVFPYSMKRQKHSYKHLIMFLRGKKIIPGL